MRPVPWWWLARLASTFAVLAVFNAAHPALHGWQLWAASSGVAFGWAAGLEGVRWGWRHEQRAILNRRALRRGRRGPP